MASITFNLELASKTNKAGKYPIYLRITQNRKLMRLKTSVELERKSDWNPQKKEIRPSEPNAAKWNEILAKEVEAAKDKYRELKETGADNDSGYYMATVFSSSVPLPNTT